MNTQTVLFLTFSAVMLVAALRVVTTRNPVHAVLFLVLAFSRRHACGCCCARSFLRSCWCSCMSEQ